MRYLTETILRRSCVNTLHKLPLLNTINDARASFSASRARRRQEIRAAHDEDPPSLRETIRFRDALLSSFIMGIGPSVSASDQPIGGYTYPLGFFQAPMGSSPWGPGMYSGSGSPFTTFGANPYAGYMMRAYLDSAQTPSGGSSAPRRS